MHIPVLFAKISSSSCYSHRIVNRKHFTYGAQTFQNLQSLAPNEVLGLFKFKIRPDNSLLHSFIQLKKKKKRLKPFPGTWREQLDTSVSYTSLGRKESNAWTPYSHVRAQLIEVSVPIIFYFLRWIDRQWPVRVNRDDHTPNVCLWKEADIRPLVRIHSMYFNLWNFIL